MLEVVDLEQAHQLVLDRFGAFALDCRAGVSKAPPGAVMGEASAPASLSVQAQASSPSTASPAAPVQVVALSEAAGRTVAHDVVAYEGVPAFDRSTVDGFAVVAADTFGCSDALPALLDLAGEVEMGAEPTCACASGVCARIPTGGQVPQGADAVVMLEYCEEYGDGTIGVARPVAPGENIVFRHDDVKPGQVLIAAGTTLLPHHIGAMASLGVTACEVEGREDGGAEGGSCEGRPGGERAGERGDRPRVAVISTGDEIVPADATPVAAQMRDVNAPLLAAAVEACGARAVRFPIVPDNFDELLETVERALAQCDMVLVSGGSSAGAKDNTARVLGQLGEVMFHGVAVKPGKPTLCADADGKPAFGLPGHPVAAYFMFLELVRPLLVGGDVPESGAGSAVAPSTGFAVAPGAAPAAGPSALPCVTATLAEGLPSNHGRAELVAVRLESRADGAFAVPVRGKSGLISQLSRADGYLAIGRNQEGIAAGAPVEVRLFK